MRPLLMSVWMLALLAGNLAAQEARLKTTLKDKPRRACHGTAVEFMGSPVEAAKLAAKQKKLVFVLHVSGHFEDPTFT